MITMSFEHYDLIYEEMMEKVIDTDFKFPDISEIPQLLATEDGFKKVMLAYLNTTDKTYRNELNRLLSRLIELTEEEIPETLNSGTGKKRLTQEQHRKIMETVKRMKFQLYGYFPDMEEIKSVTKEPTEENIAFLYWLLNTPEELTDAERKIQSELISRIGLLTA